MHNKSLCVKSKSLLECNNHHSTLNPKASPFCPKDARDVTNVQFNSLNNSSFMGTSNESIEQEPLYTLKQLRLSNINRIIINLESLQLWIIIRLHYG